MVGVIKIELMKMGFLWRVQRWEMIKNEEMSERVGELGVDFLEEREREREGEREGEILEEV